MGIQKPSWYNLSVVVIFVWLFILALFYSTIRAEIRSVRISAIEPIESTDSENLTPLSDSSDVDEFYVQDTLTERSSSSFAPFFLLLIICNAQLSSIGPFSECLQIIFIIPALIFILSRISAGNNRIFIKNLFMYTYGMLCEVLLKIEVSVGFACLILGITVYRLPMLLLVHVLGIAASIGYSYISETNGHNIGARYYIAKHYFGNQHYRVRHMHKFLFYWWMLKTCVRLCSFVSFYTHLIYWLNYISQYIRNCLDISQYEDIHVFNYQNCILDSISILSFQDAVDAINLMDRSLMVIISIGIWLYVLLAHIYPLTLMRFSIIGTSRLYLVIHRLFILMTR
jgi:hypothetical protein